MKVETLSDLIVFTRSAQEPPELSPGQELRLDRRFLTGGDDDERYSARRPPKVFFADDGWFISNQTVNQTLVLWGPTGRVAWIAPGMATKLEEGESQLEIADREVTFVVSSTAVPRQWPPDPASPITMGPDAEAVLEMRMLMRNKQTFRTIIYTRFQEYIPPPGIVSSGSFGEGRRPVPKTAAEVLICYPEATAAKVNEACREIRKVTGLHLWDTGPWLVQRELLLSTHYSDIPHEKCDHKRAD